MSGASRVSGRPRRVIALVGSSGGLHAVSKVLGSLPRDLGAAVLVMLHLEPDRPSQLSSILERRCKLPVRQAKNGDAVTEGIVLVAPPGHHMSVSADNRIVLDDEPERHFARPSAEPLCESTATVYGPEAAFVVLSGRGVDGSDSIPLAHMRGTTVVAQNQSTSEHFGMPGAAIATGNVDAILPLSAIGPYLVRWAQSTAPGPR